MARNVIKSDHSPSVSIKKLLDGLIEQLEILFILSIFSKLISSNAVYYIF